MSQGDIERILNELGEMRTQLTTMQVKLDTHCNVPTVNAAADWKTYLVFLVSGAVIGMGPAGITVLTKYLGIGG